MGLFDWLKRAFGSPRAPQVPPASPPPLPAGQPTARTLPQRQPQPSQRSASPPRAARRPAPLDLRLGDFAPLSPEQIKERARALGGALWSSPFFGRVDRIPPATDPRTDLIDRGMVALGLITPRELEHIHEVGAQVDKLRPDPSLAAHEAEAAVRRSVEERKALKARKRAEAAERRRQRAEAVARRRQTDIVFLGRGVSAGLADRRSDVEKLAAAGLPVLATPADVAQAMGLTIPRLRWLAFHQEAATRTHYVTFSVPKRSGGTRQLAAPHEALATAQQWILNNVLRRVSTHEAAHGYVPDRSTRTNASPHVGQRVLVNADLKDFFPSITVHRVIGLFRMLGYSPAVATVLALLCTECPRRKVTYARTTFHVATGPRALPQGACTSPALSNLAARSLDARLAGVARKLGWAYTRYADDLTFSSASDERVGYLLARLRHIAEDEGFSVNEAKTRVQRPSQRMTVTGVVVNAKAGVDRRTRRRLRAILHQARKTGLAAQNRANLPHFEPHVRGLIAYLHGVNPEQAEPLRRGLDELEK